MSNNLSISNLFFLDIETVPQNPEYQNLTSEWQNLWWEKVSKIVPEGCTPEESYIQRAGILAEFGKVICISTGYFYQNKNDEFLFRIKSIYGHDEKVLLEEFLQITKKIYAYNRNFEFAGHNIREFDIPYLCRRMLINQMSLPGYLYLHNAKPWDIKMVDTLQLWKFGDFKNYISLNLLANVLGIPTSKTDIDGSKVQNVYYEEQNLSRIVEYCQKDVMVVANIILRILGMPLLKEENIIVV